MAGETPITVIGNLVADPELSFTQGSGDAVANVTVASTPRTFDRQANDWKDGETLFMRGSIWREAAQNAADSLTKGMRVIATGVLKSRKFQTKEGENRTVMEMEIHEIGPSLRYATATVNRTQSTGGGGGQPQGGGGFGGGQPQGGGNWGGQQAAQPAQQQQGDPWAVPGVSNPGGGAWGGGQPAQQPAHQQPAAQPAYQQNPGQGGGGWNQNAAQQAVTRAAQGAHQQPAGQPGGYAQNPNQEPPF